MNDKIDQLNVTAKMESIEAKATDLMEEKFNEAMRKTHEIVEESYASLVGKVEDNKIVTMSEPPKEHNISFSHNIDMGFRVQGIPDDPDKTRD